MNIDQIEYIVFFVLLVIPIILMLKFKPEPVEKTFSPEVYKCESPIERRLYYGLTEQGLNPISQYPVGKYRIDLSFPAYKIAIECDGKAYHSSPSQKAHDRKKDRYLRSKGWTVLRFSGRKIHRELPSIVTKIKGYMA